MEFRGFALAGAVIVAAGILAGLLIPSTACDVGRGTVDIPACAFDTRGPLRIGLIEGAAAAAFAIWMIGVRRHRRRWTLPVGFVFVGVLALSMIVLLRTFAPEVPSGTVP